MPREPQPPRGPPPRGPPPCGPPLRGPPPGKSPGEPMPGRGGARLTAARSGGVACGRDRTEALQGEPSGAVGLDGADDSGGAIVGWKQEGAAGRDGGT